MHSTEVLSSQEPEEIRQSIELTRAGLTQKIETFKSVIEGDVADAKDFVREKVEDVKSTFDLARRVRRNPWQFVGASLAVGCVLGAILFRSHRTSTFTQDNGSSSLGGTTPSLSLGTDLFGIEGSTNNRATEVVRSKIASPREPATAGLFSRYSAEISEIQSLAVGALIGAVLDLAKTSVKKSFK